MTVSQKVELNWSLEMVGLLLAVTWFVISIICFATGHIGSGWLNLVIMYLILVVVSVGAQHNIQALAAGLAGVSVAAVSFSSQERIFLMVAGGTLWGIFTMWLAVLYGHSLGWLLTDFRSSFRPEELANRK
jgi:hypothetical protein